MKSAVACVAAPSARKSTTMMAPSFEVDPYWPKPLPHRWVLGSTIGVSVDAQDRVWIIHRPQSVDDNFKAADLKIGVCCAVAPPVLEFDQDGSLVSAWARTAFTTAATIRRTCGARPRCTRIQRRTA